MVSSITTDDGKVVRLPDGVDADDVDVARLTQSGVTVDDGGSIDIDWAFWRPQRETRHAFFSGSYDAVGFVGGYRSGKSVTGARTLIESGLNEDFAPGRYLAMGKTYAEAKKTTFPVLFEELPGENLDPFLGDGNPENSPIVRTFHKQDGIITLVNGTVIVLASADKPNRYDGGKFSAAWLDEAAYYDELNAVRKTVGERLDYEPAGPRCILITTTGNGFNDAYDILEREVDPADDTPLGIRTHLVTASTSKNPFLTDDDRDRIRRVHGGSGREGQALHGSFEADEGRVYSNFRRHSHVVDLADTDVGDDWRMYGYDAGFRDARVCLEIAKTPYGAFVVVDEFYESGTHVEDICGGPNNDTYWLQEQEQDKPKGVVYCEHEPADIQKFRRAGFKAGKAEKSIDAGIDEVRYRLREDHEGKPGLLVASRCENTIQEFLGYTEDDVGASNAADHSLDALRYAVMTESRRGSAGGSSGSSSYVEKR